MCGICVVVHPDASWRHHIGPQIAYLLSRRGPDDYQEFHHPRSPISFYHSRLSIVGGESNQQPCVTEGERHSFCLNGEVYNSTSLASQLSFDGEPSADSHVMLHGLRTKGEAFLRDIHGMWACCWYDEDRNVLSLSRDRYGIKPLYLGYSHGAFVVSSEIKCFAALEEFLEECPLGRDLYFQFGYIPAPYTIYKNVYKLEAGACMTLPLSRLQSSPLDIHAFQRYSSQPMKEVYSDRPESVITFDEALEELEALLLQSLTLRSQSDSLPVHLLSGGCDSTLLLALQKKRLGIAPPCYTAIFNEQECNEGPEVERICQELDLHHEQVLVSGEAVAENFSSVVWQFDEPFADSSTLACTLLCQAVSRHHKIAFSGDGADELFHGYRRYEYVRKMQRYRSLVPSMLRPMFSSMVSKLPVQSLKLIASYLGFDKRRYDERSLARALKIFHAADGNEAYQQAIVQWNEFPVVESDRSFSFLPLAETGSLTQVMRAFDFQYYLQDDLLVKMDRSSMAFGLEVRVPYLDHTIVSFAMRLPDSLLCDGYGGKPLIKSLLKRYVPGYDTGQIKKGFGVPLNTWLQGPLYEIAQESLQAIYQDLSLHGKRKVDAFNRGQESGDQQLWSLIVYALWKKHRYSATRVPT